MLIISMESTLKLSVIPHFHINSLILDEPGKIQGLLYSVGGALLVHIMRHVSNPIGMSLLRGFHLALLCPL